MKIERKQQLPGQAHNRLTAGNLLTLLDIRKQAKNEAEVVSACSDFGIDYALLEQLATTVNSPTYVESSQGDGMEVIWDDASYPGAARRATSAT